MGHVKLLQTEFSETALLVQGVLPSEALSEDAVQFHLL